MTRSLTLVPEPAKPTVRFPVGPWHPWFASEFAPLRHSAVEHSADYRRMVTKDSPLRFALVYLDHHLTLQDSDPPMVTFSEFHLALCRSAARLQQPLPWREAWIAPRGVGKALALDTPVLTADRGWTTHGDLRVGDRVFDETGAPCNVVRVSERWTDRPCYRVTFSDGEQIVADENHEWWVNDRYSDLAERIQTTARISEKWLLSDARGWKEVRYSLPVAGALRYPEAELPIAPYVLGAWLGDGASRAGSITVGDEDLAQLIEQLRAEGENPAPRRGGSAWTVQLAKPRPDLCPREHALEPGRPPCRTCVADFQRVKHGGPELAPRTNRPLLARLRDLDLLQNKHIPEQYFTASVAQRLALLQGLMDTDGSIGLKGTCEFTVTNERLAHDMLRLVVSMGIKAGVKESRARIGGADKGPRWRVTFHTELPVFRLPRKLARVPATIRAAGNRRIVNVERVENQTTSCIEVDSPSHLYLAGRTLVPTHNSVWFFLVLPLWAIAHKHRSFFLAFSHNESQAMAHLQNLRVELDQNQLLRDDFPELAPKRVRGARNTQTTVVSNGGTFEAVGLGATILGRRQGTDRPNFAIGDDIEPLEENYSDEQRDAQLRKILMGILPMLSAKAAFAIAGTVTKYRSITHDFVIHDKGRERIDWIADYGITPRVFPAILENPDGSLRSLWPERWPLTRTHLGEHKIGTREFDFNFMLDPRPDQVGRGGGYWLPTTFQYMDHATFNAMDYALVIDPALKTGENNDFTAIVVVGRSYDGRRAIIEHATHGHWTGEQIRRRIHELAGRNPDLRTLIFEENAGGAEHWATILEPAGRPLPQQFPKDPKTGDRVQWQWAKGHKIARAKRALAAYERGVVFHAKGALMKELEEEMLRFPDPGAHDDLIDAVAAGLRWALDTK